MSNGAQYLGVTAEALNAPVSRACKGYWQPTQQYYPVRFFFTEGCGFTSNGSSKGKGSCLAFAPP